MSIIRRVLTSFLGTAPSATPARKFGTRLGMEALESREVPSAVVTAQFDVAAKLLVVTGTETADFIYVSQDSGGVVRVRTGTTLDAAQNAVPIPIAGGTTSTGVNASALNAPAVGYAVRVDGRGGNDFLDTASAFALRVRLVGGAGADTLRGGNGNDRLEAGSGNDVVYGRGGNDYVYGGGDDDYLDGGTGNDDLYGEDGNDRLLGGDGTDVLDGGTSGDRLYGEAGPDIMRGGDGADYLDGGSEDDNMSGGLGDDELYGQSGNDTVSGSEGNDVIYGGNGNDTLRGSEDNDVLYGGEGNDYLRGDGGDDYVYGETGDDTLRGGDGDDTIHGSTGNDVIYGDSGNDTLRGSEDNDSIYGGTGNDYLRGDGGNDALYGDEDGDTLSGGDGNDYLNGGAGFDTFDGGAGDDTFRRTMFQEGFWGTANRDQEGEKSDEPVVVTGSFLNDVRTTATRDFILDIVQQQTPTCSFLATLAALAGRTGDSNDLIQAIVIDEVNDRYGVPLFIGDQWRTFWVNGDWSENGDPAGPLWVTLYQKAYLDAMAVDSRDELGRLVPYSSWTSSSGNAYQNTGHALLALTGMAPVYDNTPDAAELFGEVSWSGSVGVTAISRGSVGGGIVANHAYMVLSVQGSGDNVTVTLYNPWGHDAQQADGTFYAITDADDGQIRLTWGEFIANFQGYTHRG